MSDGVLGTIEAHPYWVGGAVLGAIVLVWLFLPSGASAPAAQAAASNDIGANQAALEQTQAAASAQVQQAQIAADAASAQANAQGTLQAQIANATAQASLGIAKLQAGASVSIAQIQSNDALQAVESNNWAAKALATIQASSALQGLQSNNATSISLASLQEKLGALETSDATSAANYAAKLAAETQQLQITTQAASQANVVASQGTLLQKIAHETEVFGYNFKLTTGANGLATLSVTRNNANVYGGG